MKWAAAIAVMGAASPAQGQTKTLIDYFLPTPIVCTLTSNTWGAPGVLPRDICNGLEDSTNQQWQYWDGKILQGADGKFHMYAGRWPQNRGFADWPNSVIVQGDSNGTLIGSYVPSASSPFTGKEQNVTGMPLNDGTFTLIDSPGNIFTAPSLNGSWTSLGPIQITANGSTISTATTENMTLWQSADGSFEIVSRTFQEMVSTKNILGPYLIQATIPSLQSQGYEDPVIWCSGGQYHLVANMYNARKAMHFTSVDGIHNWTNMGLAYDPTTNFIRYTDGTVNHWFKIERPGVVLQNGHVIAFSFAVIDVDKTLDLANDIHGTKIIVVPFDGVTFDHDNPGPGSAGCPLNGGSPVDGGTPVDAGRSVDAGQGDAGQGDAGPAVDAGSSDAGGTSGSGSSGGSSSSGGSGSSGGSDSSGGSGSSSGGAAGSGGAGSSDGSGASPDGQGLDASSNTGAGTGAGAPSNAGGCSCNTGASGDAGGAAGIPLLVGVAFAAGRRRRRETQSLPAMTRQDV